MNMHEADYFLFTYEYLIRSQNVVFLISLFSIIYFLTIINYIKALGG